MYQKRDNSTPIIAAIYCRISLARFGDTIKVDDQEKVCVDLASARGWAVHEQHIYKDPNRSAWRRNRKRPGWDAMLAAVERREINAIIVYHGDRLIRQPWDLELLLRLADDRRIQLASATGERDMGNPDDRFILRVEAAMACRESDNTSRRLRWHYEKQAEKGVVRAGGRGGRAFGFDADGVTVREAEVAVIRDVADRIIAGESVGAICRDLNARGLRTTTGGEFGHGSLSKLMQRPRLAGLLAHNGQIVGPGAWPAILDREKWESVCAALSGKAKVLGFTPTNDRRYLLSGIATCGTCGKPLACRHNTRGRQLLAYGCINPACAKKVHRAMKYVDAYVRAWVVEALSDPRVRVAMTPDVGPHLTEELERLEARRKKKIADFADDDSDLAADVLRVAVGKIDARIGEIRAELSSRLSSRAVAGLFGVSAEGFAGLPLLRQRAVVQALVRVTVLPSGRRGPVFDPSTVQLVPTWVKQVEG